ncbi:hypothetical protein ACLBSN_33015, partial [Klebsiella pneumoniae]
DESATRTSICPVGTGPTAEILDQTNNPLAHAAVIESWLTAEKPSSVPVAVDREKIPFGGSRPVAMFDHLL